MDDPNHSRKETPQETAERVGKSYFGVGEDKLSRQRDIRKWLVGIVWAAIGIPVVFFMRFGEVGPLGWGLTVFIVVLSLLVVVALYFGPRTEYHSSVPMRGDFADRVGACWLFACAFGPLLGWVITAACPITPGSWRWLYGLRVFLAAGLPVITALPLLRYGRGKTAWVLLPLLVGVTMVPVWSAFLVSRDLYAGPVVRQVRPGGPSVLYLRHTERRLVP